MILFPFLQGVVGDGDDLGCTTFCASRLDQQPIVNLHRGMAEVGNNFVSHEKKELSARENKLSHCLICRCCAMLRQ
jgi:hypothetical protein